MKEVSCRFFEALLRDLEDRKIELAPLVLGTDYTLAHLRNKNERIDWPAFVRIMENGRGFWTKEQLIEIGERSTEGTAVQFIGVVARLRFSVNGFYHWVADPDGIAKQMFHCLAVSCRDAGPARVVIELIMREGYSPNHELFWVSQGTYAAMPRMLGATKSTVSAELLPDGVRFHVQYVEPRGPAALFRRIVTWPFNARQAANELNDAHQSLQARYSELDATRDAVDRQRAVLQTAYRVGQRVLGARDVDATIAAVVEELVDDPQIAGGELRWGAEREYRAGQIGTTASAISVALRSGQAVVGSVRVWPRRPDEDDHARTLLELVGPTVALAINNSKAYHELAEHQLTLERRVDERTRDLSVARDELAATVNRLEEVQASRERLFQNISHEFRTPLALILLSVDTLMTAARGRDDEISTAHLGTVTTASRKLVRMVDELLLLAAGRERELRVHPEPLDLHAAITTAAAGWRLAADAAAQTLIVECPTDANVLADPIGLERVLANLLSNAVKFSPPGGRITITVGAGAGADDEEDRLQVAVADTGIGIDDELRARLFGRFEQGKGGIASRGGSGIGLSLARELVRAHGGDIDCLPNPGGGTIFRFSLARSTIRPKAHHGVSRLAPGDFGVATESTNVPQRFEPAGTSLGTILLAEDEPALAASIAGVLAGDYTILIAHDGATALALAEQHHPDLLITDVQMPGMDGFELTRRFRDMPGVPPAPVLLLTARAGLDDRLVGLGTGAVDYLTKPFDPDELRARVRSQLAHRELTRQLYDAEKLASLGALSAGLAHELRNPANGIVNAVAPLKELLPPELSNPDHPVTQLIDVMAECAEQVGYLSRQLLGFRRSGDLELRRVAIGDVIDRALANASAALTGIDLRTHTTYNGAIRCATPVMSQVLVNLLENAAHAAGPGGWVEISTSKRPGRVTLEVTDSGPGVPVALRDRIFEPFFTTKPPGQGTGLGLSTSRDLVQRHGGTLELRTRGERTVFAVDLPEPPEVS